MTTHRPLLIPMIVACALFMENLDSTVIATALPAMAIDLGEDPLALKLALTAYLVSLAIFIPISGWVADRVGARTTFAAAISVFILGSILCAASGTLGTFVASRFLQGLGGAMMVPVARLVLIRSVPRSGLVAALNFVTIPAMIGPIFGPAIGGLITMYFGWRWIFLINIPIGILGMLLVLKYIPNYREDEVPPLDTAGFVLSGLGLSALMLGLSTLGGHLLSTDVALALLVAGVIMLAGYGAHSRRTQHPLINLKLLRFPTFVTGVVGGGLFRIGIGAMPFLLPLMFQLGFGLSPVQSGLLTCATAVGVVFMKTLSLRILRRYGFRRVLTQNAVLASAAIALCGWMTAETPHTVIVAILLIGGCMRSLQFTCLNSISFAEVPKQEMSSATSLSSMGQRLTQSAGVVIGAYALQAAGWFNGHADIEVSDFLPAFIIVGTLSGLSYFAHRGLAKDAGAELSGNEAPPQAR